MSTLLFENWHNIFRTIVATVLAYITLIALLRISGKRTLAKMNAFDFIVTVALGSSFATVALSKDVPLAAGALVFFLLITMQFIITWLSVRFNFVKNCIASQPTMLLYKGEVLTKSLKKERITVENLYAEVRKKGIANLQQVDVIVLEPTGDITVIPKMPEANAQTLSDVGNYPQAMP